jgi:hypothetical protein
MGVDSHRKAHAAQLAGWPAEEITVYETILKDKEGNEKTVKVDRDGGIRPTTSMEGLSKLKAAFKKNGTTSAGTSSQVTDGAAVVLLARRSVAKKQGLPILGRIVLLSQPLLNKLDLKLKILTHSRSMRLSLLKQSTVLRVLEFHIANSIKEEELLLLDIHSV